MLWITLSFPLLVWIVKRTFVVVTVQRLEMMYVVHVDIGVLRMLIVVLVDLLQGQRLRIGVVESDQVYLLPILLVCSVAWSVCRIVVCNFLSSNGVHFVMYHARCVVARSKSNLEFRAAHDFHQHTGRHWL